MTRAQPMLGLHGHVREASGTEHGVDGDRPGDDRGSTTRPRGDVLIAIDVGTSGHARRSSTSRATDSWRCDDPTRRRRRRRGGRSRTPASGGAASLSAVRGAVASLAPGTRVRAIGLTGQCPSFVGVDAHGEPTGQGLIYRDNRATVEADEIRERFGDAAHPRTDRPPPCGVPRRREGALAPAASAGRVRGHAPIPPAARPRGPGAHRRRDDGRDARRRDAVRRHPDAGMGGRPPRDLGSRPALFPPSAGVVGGRRRRSCRRSHAGSGCRRASPSSSAAPTARPAPSARVSSRPGGERDGGLVDVPQRRRARARSRAARHPLPARRAGPVHDRDRHQHDRARGRLGRAPPVRRAGPGGPARPTGHASTREAAVAAPGSGGVVAVPVLGDGERTDAALRAALTGLSLRHGRAEIARAMLEGVAYEMREQLDLVRGAGAPVRELRVSGGDTRLTTWNRIKADVTGIPVARSRATPPSPAWRCSPASEPASTATWPTRWRAACGWTRSPSRTRPGSDSTTSATPPTGRSWIRPRFAGRDPRRVGGHRSPVRREAVASPGRPGGGDGAPYRTVGRAPGAPRRATRGEARRGTRNDAPGTGVLGRPGAVLHPFLGHPRRLAHVRRPVSEVRRRSASRRR